METSTTRCAAHGHPEFVLECHDDIAFMIPFLLEWIEGAVAAGTVFKPGQSVQMGWSPLQVEARDDGALTFSELDLSGEPGRRVRSVSLTLLALYRQKGVVDSFDPSLPAAFPAMMQDALCCDGFPEADALMLTRVAGDAKDSGWFFGCLKADHDHQDAGRLVRTSLYELACRRPAVIEYLAMPAGSIVLLDPQENLAAAFAEGNRPLKPVPGSYLDRERSDPPS
jgi:hypothetical protein